MPRRVAVLALALVAAGCGAQEPKTYRVDKTATCLRGDGFRVRTDAANLGVVESSAPLGSLRAFERGNTLTIAFGNDHGEAVNISNLYRRFAPKTLRRHIDDVMRVRKNAVLLWTVTPPAEEEQKIYDCLKG
jgi:hypothetical protein